MSTDTQVACDTAGDQAGVSMQSTQNTRGLEMDCTPLTFCCEFRKATTVTRSLHNPTKDKIFFKVKTTAPRMYCVRPSVSFVEPRSRKELRIIRQREEKCASGTTDPRDKFLVLWVSLPKYVKDVSSEAFDATMNHGLCRIQLRTKLSYKKPEQLD